jgi:hypothetical protein
MVDLRNPSTSKINTPKDTFFVIRKSRGMKVLREVLTEKFQGIIVCDGGRFYPKFMEHLQQCWAHLLRESKDIAEKVEEAVPLHNALKVLYRDLNRNRQLIRRQKFDWNYGTKHEQRFNTGSEKSTPVIK